MCAFIKSIKGTADFKNALGSVKLDDVLIEVDEHTRIRLQSTLLDMYKDLKQVCDKHSITPFIVEGSAIGVVRHKGFIPWDDDLDIAMNRVDYEKFLSIFESELSDRYILNAPNYSSNAKARFAKILKRGTVFREIFEQDNSVPTGVFLDVFVIDNVPKNRIIRFLKGTRCNILQFISSQVYIYENNNDLTREVLKRTGTYSLKMFIGKIFSWRSASKWFDVVDKACRYKHTGKCGIVTARNHYFGEIFDENVLYPAKQGQFCDIEVPVFNDIDAYLSCLYGDYMKIPPVEKRERHFVKELKL